MEKNNSKLRQDSELDQQKVNIVKIVLFGPESTGKTTLSQQLARHYNTVWAPEFAREYLQNKWNNHRKTCENSDLIPIAIGQMKLENNLAKKADKILICDTDLLETKVYSQEYYGGFVAKKLNKAAKENNYDLYLLTYIDTPWEADDLRDRPELRLEMFNAFENALKSHDKNYILLKGNKETRLKKAIKAIDKIMNSKDNLHSFSENLEDLDMHFMYQKDNINLF
ncbi:MAG: ATP-binding protein [Flavobacteriaceae bacterium]|nr:ATP-binding protein [Flavobacteriaceae bacterium]